jgi:hypothetical protein
LLIHKIEYEESNHCGHCDSHGGSITVTIKSFLNETAHRFKKHQPQKAKLLNGKGPAPASAALAKLRSRSEMRDNENPARTEIKGRGHSRRRPVKRNALREDAPDRLRDGWNNTRTYDLRNGVGSADTPEKTAPSSSSPGAGAVLFRHSFLFSGVPFYLGVPAHSEKRNAAQAEYNRLAALVSPGAPKIPPTRLCLRSRCQGSRKSRRRRPTRHLGEGSTSGNRERVQRPGPEDLGRSAALSRPPGP